MKGFDFLILPNAYTSKSFGTSARCMTGVNCNRSLAILKPTALLAAVTILHLVTLFIFDILIVVLVYMLTFELTLLN